MHFKSFFRATNLKGHRQEVHDGHKDFKCESCNTPFSRVANLKGHIQILHEGHKNHKCEYYDKSFSLMVNLKGHIQALHKDYKIINVGTQETHLDYNSNMNLVVCMNATKL